MRVTMMAILFALGLTGFCAGCGDDSGGTVEVGAADGGNDAGVTDHHKDSGGPELGGCEGAKCDAGDGNGSGDGGDSDGGDAG